jgi:hypothetical protein
VSEREEVRYWTVEEARAVLPSVRAALETLRSRVAGGETPPSDEGVRHALGQLDELDIVLRDPAVGLIDFWARDDRDEPYLLCYRLDDPDLGWWHRPEDGFAGRRPLPRANG